MAVSVAPCYCVVFFHIEINVRLNKWIKQKNPCSFRRYALLLNIFIITFLNRFKKKDIKKKSNNMIFSEKGTLHWSKSRWFTLNKCSVTPADKFNTCHQKLIFQTTDWFLIRSDQSATPSDDMHQWQYVHESVISLRQADVRRDTLSTRLKWSLADPYWSREPGEGFRW